MVQTTISSRQQGVEQTVPSASTVAVTPPSTDTVSAEQAWQRFQEGGTIEFGGDRTNIPIGKMLEFNQALANLVNSYKAINPQLEQLEVLVNDSYNVSTAAAIRGLAEQLGLTRGSGLALTGSDYQAIISESQRIINGGRPGEQVLQQPTAAENSLVNPESLPLEHDLLQQFPAEHTASQTNAPARLNSPQNPELDPAARFDKLQRNQERIAPGAQSYALIEVVSLLNQAREQGLNIPALTVPENRIYNPEIQAAIREFRSRYSLDSEGDLVQHPTPVQVSDHQLTIDYQVARALALVTGREALSAEQFREMQPTNEVSPRTEAALGWLSQQLGKPYIWGGGRGGWDCITLALAYARQIDPNIPNPRDGRGDQLALSLEPVGAITLGGHPQINRMTMPNGRDPATQPTIATTSNSEEMIALKGFPNDVQIGDIVGIGHPYAPGGRGESHYHLGVVSRVMRDQNGNITDIMYINASGTQSRGGSVREQSVLAAIRPNGRSTSEDYHYGTAFFHRVPVPGTPTRYAQDLGL